MQVAATDIRPAQAARSRVGAALSVVTRLRVVICLMLLIAGMLVTHELPMPVRDVAIRPASSEESQLTYDPETGIVQADGKLPALEIDFGARVLTVLQLQITGIEDVLRPNYDMTDLHFQPGSSGEALRPIASARPDIRTREIMWKLATPTSGSVWIYPPRDSRFVLHGVYTSKPPGGLPLFVIVAGILTTYIALAKGTHHRTAGTSNFSTFGQSVWSVAVVFWAGLCASFVFIRGYSARSQGAMQPYMVQDWPEFFVDEAPERLLVAIFYLAGGSAALIGPVVLRRFLASSAALWAAVGVFIPVGALAAAAVMEPYRTRVESTPVHGVPGGAPFWLVVPGAALLAGLIGGLRGFRNRAEHAQSPPRADTSTEPISADGGASQRKRWVDVAVIAALAAASLPTDAQIAAARIGYETHIVSYLIGPAMYSAYADGLVPGRDYFAQYGVGFGPLFAPFLGGSAESAIEHYVVLSSAVLFVFFALAYLMCCVVLRSRLWAVAVVAIGFFHHFHLAVSGNGNMFDPTGWPIRFPLLPVFVWALVRALVQARGTMRADVISHGLIAVLVATSVFLNTETGLFMVMTTIATFVLLLGASRYTAAVCVFLVAAVAAIFGALSAAAFGWGVFSRDYVWGLYMPLVVYSGGWSARMIDWMGHWTVFYAFLLPAIAIATVAWGARESGWQWFQIGAPARETIAWRVALSILGLLLVAKFYNRSLNTLWWFNSFPLVLVAASWLRTAWLNHRTTSPWWITRAQIAAAVTAVAVYLGTLADPRPDNVGFTFGLNAWLHHPTIFSRALGVRQVGAWPEGGVVLSPRVVQAVQERVRPGERVALVSPADWRYLIPARRAPKAHYLPHPELQLTYQLDASIADAPFIFLHLDPTGTPRAASRRTMWGHLAPILASQYRLETTIDDVAIYSRTENAASHF